jgi:uncharacterized protein
MTTQRLVCLDFVRGVAVLGILLMNIVGFAWPEAAVVSPRAPLAPRGHGDEAVFLAHFVLVDGKFRGLFSLLFGASMVLLVERGDAAGMDGIALQQRRLAWLALFGLAHFFLLWWGDILFLYALCGFAALVALDWPVRRLAGIGLLLYAAGILWMAMLTLPEAMPWLDGSEQARVDALAETGRRLAAEANAERELYLEPWAKAVGDRVRGNWDKPLTMVMTSGLETLPLMLLGMAMLRSGLLTGAWPIRRTATWALAGIGLGLVATLPLAWWIADAGYPMPLVLLINLALAAPARLAMTVGYAALLVLLAWPVAPTRLGRRVIAAGQMAFSNYLGTSLMMTALFHGWGLGLYARFSRLELLGFVALAWLAMLAWSKPWLARFRHGPLEWLWRSLVHGSPQPLRRLANATDSH